MSAVRLTQRDREVLAALLSGGPAPAGVTSLEAALLELSGRLRAQIVTTLRP